MVAKKYNLFLTLLCLGYFLNGQVRPEIEWVSIPKGTFNMGSPSTEIGRFEKEFFHQDTVQPFKISKYEITFAQYDLFCEATKKIKPSDEGWGRGNRPVINVSWDDANAFAEWLGCRLPTEAEWEYAARAGTSTPFNTGDCIDTKLANFDGNFPYIECNRGVFLEKTLPVGSFAPNQWGLYDMHGNVWEWCSDLFNDYDNSGNVINESKSTIKYKVNRGGSWNSYANLCRSAYRNYDVPYYKDNILGFRVVMSE